MVNDKPKYFGSHLGNCPPEDARTASGVFYRLVKKNLQMRKILFP